MVLSQFRQKVNFAQCSIYNFSRVFLEVGARNLCQNLPKVSPKVLPKLSCSRWQCVNTRQRQGEQRNEEKSWHKIVMWCMRDLLRISMLKQLNIWLVITFVWICKQWAKGGLEWRYGREWLEMFGFITGNNFRLIENEFNHFCYDFAIRYRTIIWERFAAKYGFWGEGVQYKHSWKRMKRTKLIRDSTNYDSDN